MSTEKPPSPSLSFIAAWVLANLIGWASGLVLGQSLAPSLASLPISWPFDRDLLSMYVTVAVLGLTVGAFQSIAIRRSVARPSSWLAATIMGFATCLGIFAVANSIPVSLARTETLNNAILLAIMGTAIGICQFWVLRQRHGRSGIWVPVSAVAFLFFLWVIIDPSRSQGEFYVRATVAGTMAAVVTGTILYVIMRPSLGGISLGAPSQSNTSYDGSRTA